MSVAVVGAEDASILVGADGGDIAPLVGDDSIRLLLFKDPATELAALPALGGACPALYIDPMLNKLEKERRLPSNSVLCFAAFTACKAGLSALSRPSDRDFSEPSLTLEVSGSEEPLLFSSILMWR
jgi:hypothetical protein